MQFLKARSHVAHALSEGYRNTRFVNADEATSSPVRYTGRVGPTQTEAMAALLVAAMLLTFAGARFLPAADDTPVKQAELLPALTAPAWKIAESAVAQRISPPEVGVRTAQATFQACRRSTHFTAGSERPDCPGTQETRLLRKCSLKVTWSLILCRRAQRVLINQRPAGQRHCTSQTIRRGRTLYGSNAKGYKRWTAGVLVQADKTTRIRPVLLSKPDRQSANIESGDGALGSACPADAISIERHARAVK